MRLGSGRKCTFCVCSIFLCVIFVVGFKSIPLRIEFQTSRCKNHTLETYGATLDTTTIHTLYRYIGVYALVCFID